MSIGIIEGEWRRIFKAAARDAINPMKATEGHAFEGRALRHRLPRNKKLLGTKGIAILGAIGRY